MNDHVLSKFYQRIQNSDRFDQLRMLRDEAHLTFIENQSSTPSLEWYRKVNKVHDWFIEKTIVLSEEMLGNRGTGVSPVPFAFILFGSGGRKEQMLWSDQDNGLIYANPEGIDKTEVEDYFHILVGTILHGLQIVGYPPCDGNVLASNPRWRKPVIDWEKTIEGWLSEPNWENIRYLLIFADSRSVYGDPSFIERIRKQIHQYIEANPEILTFLLNNTLHHKVSLGVFGQLIKERYGEDAGGLDIKYGAYIPMVNGVRLLAMMTGINETSTESRIIGLHEKNIISLQMRIEWLGAFAKIIRFRSQTPYNIIEGMYVSRGKLTAEDIASPKINVELKHCLKTGNELQKFARKMVHSRTKNLD